MQSAIASPIPQPEWACDPAFCTTTLNCWPASTDLLDKTGLPFGITFHPLAEPGIVSSTPQKYFQKKKKIIYNVLIGYNFRKFQSLTLVKEVLYVASNVERISIHM